MDGQNSPELDGFPSVFTTVGSPVFFFFNFETSKRRVTFFLSLSLFDREEKKKEKASSLQQSNAVYYTQVTTT